ncbi:hypothetical protein [Vibrio stylophorae]|nr:hypothetical protein [Vibrio stylophorae]
MKSVVSRLCYGAVLGFSAVFAFSCLAQVDALENKALSPLEGRWISECRVDETPNVYQVVELNIERGIMLSTVRKYQDPLCREVATKSALVSQMERYAIVGKPALTGHYQWSGIVQLESRSQGESSMSVQFITAAIENDRLYYGQRGFSFNHFSTNLDCARYLKRIQ